MDHESFDNSKKYYWIDWRGRKSEKTNIFRLKFSKLKRQEDHGAGREKAQFRQNKTCVPRWLFLSDNEMEGVRCGLGDRHSPSRVCNMALPRYTFLKVYDALLDRGIN